MIIKGKPSGDGECFCFEVTEEEYRRVCGDESWKLELETFAIDDEDARECGREPIPPSKRCWRIYPSEIMMVLKVERNKEVALEIKVHKEKYQPDEALVANVREWLGEEGINQFRKWKEEHGTVSPVIGGLIPHPVHFREGMHVRNKLRELTNNSWTSHEYDERWTSVIEEAIRTEAVEIEIEKLKGAIDYISKVNNPKLKDLR